MADNYLENKMEEWRSMPAHRSRPGFSLERLLERNRSCRGYDSTYHVREDQLRSIIGVNTRLASARNAQTLRFRMVQGEEARRITPLLKMGVALPELHLPLESEQPSAYIVICSVETESRFVDIDMGISVQSMLLRAVEMGLNGLCVAAFDKEEVRKTLGLELEPLLVVAFGRSVEKYRLKPVEDDSALGYYRENGVHVIPKLTLEQIIIK